MKFINLILCLTLINLVYILAREIKNYNIEQEEILAYANTQKQRLSNLEEKVNLTFNKLKNKNKAKNNEDEENLRIEFLSLLSVTIRYFLNISEEQGNLIKLLENVNAYNEATEEEKNLMQKALQENIERLRKENRELVTAREGLKDIVTKLKDNSLE